MKILCPGVLITDLINRVDMHIQTYQVFLRCSRADQQLVLESRCLSIINTPQSGLISLSDMLHSHFSTPSNVLRHRIWERWQQLWIATFFFFFFFANKPGVSLASWQSKDPKFGGITFFLIKNEKEKADNLKKKEHRLLFSPNITGCTAVLAAVSRCFVFFIHPPSTVRLTKNDSHVMLSSSCCGFVPVELLYPTGWLTSVRALLEASEEKDASSCFEGAPHPPTAVHFRDVIALSSCAPRPTGSRDLQIQSPYGRGP